MEIECFLFYYDFLFGYFKVFLLEVVLNKMMDFDFWLDGDYVIIINDINWLEVNFYCEIFVIKFLSFEFLKVFWWY